MIKTKILNEIRNHWLHRALHYDNDYTVLVEHFLVLTLQDLE